MKTLHIVRNPNDHFAYGVVSKERARGQKEVSLLLMHDAVYTPPPEHARLFACRDDVEARGVKSPARLVNYEEIVELLLDSESVCSW
jgi:sulfur relay protein TusB/DsrH